MMRTVTFFLLGSIAIASCVADNPLPPMGQGGATSTTSGSGGSSTSSGGEGGSLGDGGSSSETGGTGGTSASGGGGTAGSGGAGLAGSAGSSGAGSSSGGAVGDGGARTCKGGYPMMCPAPYSVSGTIDDLCKSYCQCMMTECTATMPADCVNTCKAKANVWDLCCRIKMCLTRPCDYKDQWEGDCKAAVGIQACLDKI